MNTENTDKTADALPEKYVYVGDVNVEYGGTYYELNESDWENGYVNAVRVTDLDSGCGFTGAVLIEKVTIIVAEKYFDESLSCCGWARSDVDLTTDSGKLQLADALLSYGHYDHANEYYESANEVIQTQEDGPMQFDGWKASKRVLSENLEGYIRNQYLG